jgi:molybdopterin molybdotransferase
MSPAATPASLAASTPASPDPWPALLAALPAHDAEATPVALAQQLIDNAIAQLAEPPAAERVPLAYALGRVLAEPVISSIDVPAHDNSAMDGYALRGADLVAGQPLTLRVVGTVLAGQPFGGALMAGECVRIMTGAVLPDGLDTVIPQELCQADTRGVHLPAGAVRPGDNRRRRGEDLAVGGIALPAGRVLRASDLGLIASLGLAEVRLRRRLRVAFFSTGDELRAPGQPLDAGCIYDSNRYSLLGALLRLGVEPIDLGLVRDDPVALETTLRLACEQADVVLTSGGVSGGDADYTHALIQRLGHAAYLKLAMRPGRPFALGRLQQGRKTAWLFALPGNPVASLVAFYLLVRPALLQLAGAAVTPLPRIRARSTQVLRKRPGRTECQRGRLSRADDGHWQVTLTGAQGSGMLSSMSEADGLVLLEADQATVQVGDWVDVLPFEALA